MAEENIIQKHGFIPKHVKLEEKEKEEVLKYYNISINQLPSIFNTDPAIKELNLQSGGVIKITRNSQTSTEAIFYRVVING